MKKISFILLALLCWSSMVSAQENNNRLRKKYRNLSFVKQEFEPASYFGMDQTLKSNFGAAFTVGRTFYLHKKPIAGLIRFGLDATWFDLNYTNYKLEYHWEDNYDEEEEPETSNFHQAEIGMQVGPSVTVNPVGKLNVNAYFRFAPSFQLYTTTIPSWETMLLILSPAAVSLTELSALEWNPDGEVVNLNLSEAVIPKKTNRSRNPENPNSTECVFTYPSDFNIKSA